MIDQLPESAAVHVAIVKNDFTAAATFDQRTERVQGQAPFLVALLVAVQTVLAKDRFDVIFIGDFFRGRFARRYRLKRRRSQPERQVEQT